MTTFPMETTAYSKFSYARINAGIRSLDIRQLRKEQPLLAPTQNELVARAARIYAGVRPLLMTLTVLPFLRASWRTALMAFFASLDLLLVTTLPETPLPEEQQFKAGKDQAGRKRGASLTFQPIRKVARDARDGRFITREQAHRRPNTTVVEKVKYAPRPASRKQ